MLLRQKKHVIVFTLAAFFIVVFMVFMLTFNLSEPAPTGLVFKDTEEGLAFNDTDTGKRAESCTELEEGQQQLEARKATMPGLAPDSDILDLNVGGKLMSVKRSTLLLQPDTMLATMFSARHDNDLDLDARGRIFLDYNPAFMELLLNYLRAKRMDTPAHRAHFPTVSVEQQVDFQNFLRVLGFLPARSLIAPPSWNGRNYFSHSGLGTQFVAQPALEVGCVFRVHLQGQGPANYIGVTLAATSTRHDPDNAWSSRGSIYLDGQAAQDPHWLGWMVGDEALFKFTASSLQMYHFRCARLFAIDLSSPGPWYFHVNSAYTVTIYEASELDHTHFV